MSNGNAPRKITFMNVIRKVGSFLRKFWKLMTANKKTLIGFIIFSFFVLVAVFGPIIFPYSSETHALDYFAAPTWEHPLGTDELGRDVFRQLIDGTRDVLGIAVLTSLITVSFGTLVGVISGYIGGWVDRIIQVITNLFLCIPSLPVLLMFSAMFNISNAISFALILSLFSWAGLCRAVRSQIMSLKERDFILICQVMNVNKIKIITKELIPNIISYVFINFIVVIRNAIIGSVGIMMLGLASFQPSNWGAMLFRAKANITSAKAIYLIISPIICIGLIQAGSILLSNGLDETLNPKLKRN